MATAVLLVGLCAFVAPSVPSAAAAKLRIKVGGADFQPFPIAVPALDSPDDPSLGQALTGVLQADIDLGRHFLLVPPSTYLVGQHAEGQRPSFLAWQNVGASGLIAARIIGKGADRRLALAFFDVHGQKETLARTCAVSATKAAASRATTDCVHAFLDELVASLTGEAGIYGTRIAFVRREGASKTIWTADVDGGQQEPTVRAGTLSLLPAWEPATGALLFTSYLTGRALLYRQLPGGPPRVLSQRRGLNMGAALSPDGQSVALTLSQDGQAEIYTMRPDGSRLVRLTKGFGQDVSPTWSPDGQRIAFVSSRTGSPQIYLMNKDGSGQRRLTYQGTYNQEPDWSPRADGKIVFTARDETLHYDLFTVEADSGKIVRLTQDTGDNDSPSFAPDGRHIVFASTRGPGRRRALYIMDELGKKVRPVGGGLLDVETPAWGPRPLQRAAR